MSVFAFVQSPQNDGTVIFVKDGVIIDDQDEVYNYLHTIESCFQLAKNKQRPTYIKNEEQHIFVGFHKKKDSVNRRREFLLCWNSNDDKEVINKTAEKIGITKEFNFDSLDTKKSTFGIGFYLLIIGIVLVLYKIFNK